jgi:hypothetical protein
MGESGYPWGSSRVAVEPVQDPLNWVLFHVTVCAGIIHDRYDEVPMSFSPATVK